MLPADPSPENIFMFRYFEQPLVPTGGGPQPAQNAALAVALNTYAKRSCPDDFFSIADF
jgi:hypothetical protein